MRREDYERAYGRRGMPPPVSSLQDSRNRRSKRKMRCLISIGLILPALAAVIGVAAWAVSADVVMSSRNDVSGNSNRANKADSVLLQDISGGRSVGQRDGFLGSQEIRDPLPPEQPQLAVRLPERLPITTTPRTSTSTTTKEPTDVGAILSKLISASGAASGGSGPRFVVVAPLPDTGKVSTNKNKEPDPPPISRADYAPTANTHTHDSWRPKPQDSESDRDAFNNNADLVPAASQIYHQVQPPSYRLSNNKTNRVGLTSNNKFTNQRRSNEPSFVINLNTKNNHRLGFNSQPVEMSGFEPFMSPESLLGSPSMHIPAPPAVPGYVAKGPFSSGQNGRGPPTDFFSNKREHGKPNPIHVFEPNHPSMYGVHQNDHPQSMSDINPGVNPGFGLKPIQQHLQHHDIGVNNGPSPQADESRRWGSYHAPPVYVPKAPEGVSLSISQPSASGHSGEPVSVIKSFFLPFVPRPKVKLNARVVFGVVLDKGLGFGDNKKQSGYRPIY